MKRLNFIMLNIATLIIFNLQDQKHLKVGKALGLNQFLGMASSHI